MYALRNGWLNIPSIKRVKQLYFDRSLQFIAVYDSLEKVETEEYYYFPSIESAIYNHEFCKAVFGDGWEEHLKNMVMEKNRYKYLIENYAAAR
jgi:hypothetical protein